MAVLRIADKWLENAPIPGDYVMRNGLMVQVGQNGSVGGPSPMAAKNKSPSFHSNMSVDGAGNIIASPGSGAIDENVIAKSYEDHWVFEKIILERV